MSATATEKPKRKAKGTNGTNGRMPRRLIDSVRSTSPDQTGTTTPAGIAANDPDAVAFADREDVWAKLAPRLSEICQLPKGNVEPVDHQQASWLLNSGVGGTMGAILEAKRLVAKYFPGESPPTKVDRLKRDLEVFTNASKALKKQAAEPKESRVIERLSLAQIRPHPKNDPSRNEDTSLAESLRENQLLEPIVVRSVGEAWPSGKPVWEILSGHRRVAGARSLGWQTIEAEVRKGMSDADALAFVALHNAKRKDLSPIEKAEMIRELCRPVSEGGGGMTREQAAKVYDLESGAAASNLVRLLELPKVWQDRVASGELPWTWARELIPYVGLAPVMAKLEEDWKEREDAQDSYDSVFVSRSALVSSLPDVAQHECRRVDEEHYVNGQYRRLSIDAINPEVRKRLGIVELTLPTGRKGKTETVQLATNVKAFDALLTKLREQKAKASAEKVGRDKPSPKRELSAAEKKQRAADRTKQLNARIADWRHKLLRRLLVGKLEAKEDSGFRLVMAYAADPPRYRGPTVAQLLTAASGKRPNRSDYRDVHWAAVADAKDARRFELTRAMAINLLKHEADDWRFPTLPHALVERYAEDLHVDVAGGWAALQTGQKPDPMLEEFLLLFQTSEAQDLAKELGAYVQPNATRGAIVKKLLGVPPLRRLKLPRCIKPVAGVAKGKATKPAKRGAKS